MKLKITLLTLFCCTLLSAQSFREIQLPEPADVSPLFIGPINKSTIHYGATPENFNGKVILFTHGFADLNQSQFLRNNSFYEDTFITGYQAVFVATTRGKGFWVNGELLAEAIDIITDKYNVEEVTVIAHSNGAKATEAAMFHHGKKDKVKQVFALATPYWGTYLADLSQLPLLNWVWRLTGLNSATKFSTTYYCRDVARPYFDTHPDNQPEKFTTLAGSGFYKGSPFTGAGGLILLAADQGVNDGVTAYTKSLRPGAENLFIEKDPRALIDHFRGSQGQFAWPYIQPLLEEERIASNPVTTKTIDQNIISSNYYIANSFNDYDNIVLDHNTKNATLEIIHEDASAPFQIIKDGAVVKEDQFSDTHKTFLEVSDSNISLESTSNYVAFVKSANAIHMTLEKKDRPRSPLLNVYFQDEQQKLNNTDIQVTGIITKISEIDGSPANEKVQIITFDNTKEQFSFDTSNLEDGVYSLLVNGKKENHFKRSIVSGFVVGTMKQAIPAHSAIASTFTPNTSKSNVFIYPTVVKNEARIVTSNKRITKNKTTIYTIDGRMAKSFELSQSDTNEIEISNQIHQLQKGIYILTVEGIGTTKFIKQ